jgi:hypothetical protein
MKNTQAAKFCRCIKAVKKTVRLRKGSGRGEQAKEQAAIAICTARMLQTRGRTLRRFSCTKKGGPMLSTQKALTRKRRA